jgi:hypothetical protein
MQSETKQIGLLQTQTEKPAHYTCVILIPQLARILSSFLFLQVFERVPSGTMSVISPTQMQPASTLHVLSLALYEPKTKAAH